MALLQNTYVYMETMEARTNQIPKPKGYGSSQRPGMESGKQQTWLLVYNTYSCYKYGNDKRKTDKSDFYDLATAYQSVHVNYSQHCIREPYVQCCERTAVSHRLLLE